MINPRTTVPWLAACVLALSPQALPAQGDQGGATRSSRDGVYTTDQAERGAKLSADNCAACHMQDFFTQTLLTSWSGAPANMLFDLIRTTMPQDQPSSLTRQQYADILAYIFRLNGLPPGEEELGASDDALKKILIEGRQ
jgi:mono/diheme cytochrome c family protein